MEGQPGHSDAGRCVERPREYLRGDHVLEDKGPCLLAPFMKKILMIYVPYLPTPWARTRSSRTNKGYTRVKHASVGDWQRLLKSVALEEVYGRSEFPHAGPLFVSINVLTYNEVGGRLRSPAQVSLEKSDGDNMEKAIYDALSKVVWKDDNIKNIPRHFFNVDQAMSDEVIGTYITVYEL